MIGLRRYPAIHLLMAAVVTAGCRDAKPASPPEVVLRSESVLRDRFGAEVRQLLAAGQYDSLENLATSLRQTGTRWPNGGWKLRTYYYQGFDESLRSASDAEWQGHLQHLREWRRSMPRSITAPVALANALVGYAWQARGSGYGNDVDEAEARAARARLGEARSVLVAARDLPRVCPGWWAAAQRVALGEGWERPFYDELFREAVRAEPTFDAYYDLKALHLLPRWYGKQGEWVAFADTMANQLPAPSGEQSYARMVWYVQRYISANIFVDSEASWDRTRRGFDELIKAYPASLELKSAFAYLAWQAADQPTARQQFTEIGTRIDPGVWEDRTEFLEAWRWAFDQTRD